MLLANAKSPIEVIPLLISIVVKVAILLNAFSDIDVIVFGRTRSTIAVFSNALIPIVLRLSPRITFSKDVLFLNAELPIVITESGIST